MTNPKIYLAIDNCFSSKRWTEPKEWMAVVKDLGILHVEASADNECDPLYSTPEYLERWKYEIKEYGAKYGVEVCNMYSGHGTYATLGLSHTDKSVRNHIQDDWLKRMIDTASSINAGLGFYCHAFNHNTLQDKNLYTQVYNDLIESLTRLSSYSNDVGLKSIAVEQMYSPHQIPWTVKGARDLMKEVFRKSSNPFYITIDVGHQSGQRKFLKPNLDMIRKSLDHGDKFPAFWLGSDKTYALYSELKTASSIRREDLWGLLSNEIENNLHLYATSKDGDPYYWLEKLGGYSPIIHLQQTDGTQSAHKPFTAENNANGIIDGTEILKSLQVAFQEDKEKGMPPKCKNVYLTIEVFSGTADMPIFILKNLEKTVEYWRKYLPKDGLSLNELIEN